MGCESSERDQQSVVDFSKNQVLPASEDVEGLQAPNFQLLDQNGQSHSLYQILDANNYVLLNFWATWCPPCLEELPSMEDLNQRLKGKLFSMVAVSVDDTQQDIAVFLDRLRPRQLSFLILHDPGKMVAEGLYGTVKFPESYLIAPDRKIVKKYVGPRNWTDSSVLNEMTKLIEGKAE